MTVKVQLSAVGINTTLFDIYSNFNNVTPIASGISKMALLAGYYLSPVPDGATTIRVVATGTCTNYTDMPISGLTTTTTTTATPTTTTTTTLEPTTTTTTTLPILSYDYQAYRYNCDTCVQYGSIAFANSELLTIDKFYNYSGLLPNDKIKITIYNGPSTDTPNTFILDADQKDTCAELSPC